MGASVNPVLTSLLSAGALAVLSYGVVAFLRRPKPEPTDNLVHWGPLQSVAIVVMMFVVAQIAAVALLYVGAGILGQARFQLDDQSTLKQFVTMGLVDAVSLAMIGLLLRIKQTHWRSIGWVRPRWLDVAYVVAGFAVYFISFICLAAALHAIFPSIDLNQKQDVGYSTLTQGWGLVPIFFGLVILTPITEELLVRGVLYSGLRRRLSFVWAMLITSSLFASAHLAGSTDGSALWIAGIDTFCLSIVLVYMREKTGSLWPGIGLHATKNFIAFLSLFVFMRG